MYFHKNYILIYLYVSVAEALPHLLVVKQNVGPQNSVELLLVL